MEKGGEQLATGKVPPLKEAALKSRRGFGLSATDPESAVACAEVYVNSTKENETKEGDQERTGSGDDHFKAVVKEMLNPSPTDPFVKWIQDWVAGGVSSAITKTLTAPLELVKLTLQTQDANFKVVRGDVPRCSGAISCIVRVVRENSFFSLWRGNGANVLRYFPAQVTSFLFKDFSRTLLPNYDPKTEYWKWFAANMLSGGISGAASLLVLYPLDFAHTRLAGGEFEGVLDCIQHTVNTDGVAALYKGFGISVLGIVAHRAAYVWYYDFCRKRLKPRSEVEKFLIAQNVVLLAGVATYPLDTLRRRLIMQAGASPAMYAGAVDCCLKILQHEGVGGFFKGAGVNVVRGIGSALALHSKRRVEAAVHWNSDCPSTRAPGLIELHPMSASEVPRHNAWVKKKQECESLRMAGSLQAAVEMAQSCVDEALLWGRSDLEATALCEMGMALEAMGRHQTAIECFERQATIAEERGEEEVSMIARLNHGISLLSLQRPDCALPCFSDVLAYAQRKRNARLEAAARVNMATALAAMARLRDAQPHLESAMGIMHDSRDLYGKARALGTLGNLLYDSGQYDQAEKRYLELIQLAQQIQDPFAEGSSCGQLGLVYMQLHRPREAFFMMETQLTIAREHGIQQQEIAALTNRAALHESSGRLDLAIADIERCHEICRQSGNAIRLCTVQHNLGILCSKSCNYAAALQYLSMARSTAVEHGLPKCLVGEFLTASATIYLDLGQAGRAIAELTEAIHILASLDDALALRRAQKSLGGAYLSINENARAAFWFEKSLPDTPSALQTGDNAGSLCNLATARANQGHFADAEELYRRHLAIVEKNADSGYETAKLHGGLGNLFARQGRWEDALEAYAKEIAFVEAAHGDEQHLASAKNNYGLALLQAGRYAEAKQTLLDALASVQRQENSLPDDDSLRVSLFEISKHSFSLLQQALVQLGEHNFAFAAAERSKARSLATAIDSRRRSSAADTDDRPAGFDGSAEWKELRDTIRAGGAVILEYTVTAARTVLIWMVLPDGGDATCVQIELDAHVQGDDATEDLITVLQMALASMGVTGRNHQLCDASGSTREEMAGAAIARDAGHRRQLLALYVQHAEAQSKMAPDKLGSAEGGEARQLDDAELETWEQIHRDPALLLEMKEGLKEHRAVLRWLTKIATDVPAQCGWNDDQTSQWWEGMEQMKSRPSWDWVSVAEISAQSLADVFGFQDKMLRQTMLNLVQTLLDEARLLKCLHELLVPPEVREAIRVHASVVIVPHEDLFRVPWAALMDEGGRYLVEHAAIRLTPSLRVADRLVQPHADSLARRMVVVGNPCGTLPKAEEEARAVASELQGFARPDDGGAVVLRMRSAATPSEVRSIMDGAQWVHLACHGLLERRALLMAAPPSPEEPSATRMPQVNDHDLLRMEDLATLRLAAGSTVVLSACNTGLGQILGEGVVGVSRAFLLAGASATVSSLWSVKDGSTQRLMQCAYTLLREGLSVEEAMRHAMLFMLGPSPAAAPPTPQHDDVHLSCAVSADGADSLVDARPDGSAAGLDGGDASAAADASRSWLNQQGRKEQSALEALFNGGAMLMLGGSPVGVGNGLDDGGRLTDSACKQLFGVWKYPKVFGVAGAAVAQAERVPAESVRIAARHVLDSLEVRTTELCDRGDGDAGHMYMWRELVSCFIGLQDELVKRSLGFSSMAPDFTSLLSEQRPEVRAMKEACPPLQRCLQLRTHSTGTIVQSSKHLAATLSHMDSNLQHLRRQVASRHLAAVGGEENSCQGGDWETVSRGRVGVSRESNTPRWSRPVHWAGFVVIGGQTRLR